MNNRSDTVNPDKVVSMVTSQVTSGVENLINVATPDSKVNVAWTPS